MACEEVVAQGLSILNAASLRRKVVTPAKAANRHPGECRGPERFRMELDSGFRRNDGLPLSTR
jgi:hypothetical protein